MKGKIAYDLPSREKLVAGLTKRELHPQLVRAEQAVADAERELERRRRDLADRERRVAELPAQIRAGAVSAKALPEALRERDAAALMIAGAEEAVKKARERVPVEERAAKLAVSAEFTRRVEVLEKAAAEFAPVLEEINALATALAATQGPEAMLTTIAWPESPAAGGTRRIMLGLVGGGAK